MYTGHENKVVKNIHATEEPKQKQEEEDKKISNESEKHLNLNEIISEETE